MSLFAGVYALKRRKPVDKTTVKRMTEAFSSTSDETAIFSIPYFFLVKFDFGAFGEPGFLVNETQGITAIAGEPILTLHNEEKYSRFSDLGILSEHVSQGRFDILNSCNGTYSICVYTPSNHAVILATDKLGSRPVYYYVDDDFLYFSSCLKILESIESIPRRADIKAFVEQYVFGVPLGNKTLYADIKVLRDGQYFMADDERLQSSFYFRWDQIPVLQKSQEDLLDACYSAFTSAVKSRSHRSQQVFSFLSGGLDSRCVVAMLHVLGKEVIAFNCSRPDEQDQIFAEQYANRLGVRYVAAQRSPDVASTARLFEEAIKTTSHELKNLEYPQLVFSGDGGSVGVGFVYMDETLFDFLKEGKIEQAIQYFLKDRGKIPQKIIQPEVWQQIKYLPFNGMQEELADLNDAGPEQSMFLFLARNDQRRHLHGYYENIDQHRVELLIPFYDPRLLEIIASASTLHPFLYHDFYHKWLQLFPEPTHSVPWQTYPGHLSCPVGQKGEMLSQWQKYQQDEFLIGKPWVKKCIHILGKAHFPGQVISRAKILLALLLHSLRIRNYTYIFKFCVNLYEQYSKCTSIHLGDSE